MLGYELHGDGPTGVIVLNDWLCDTSTWDDARKLLDPVRFTWAFVDLRGYGRSRGQTGAFSVAEAAADVLAVADARGWARFAVVGHSMSTLVAVHLGQHHADRVTRLVLASPASPAGLGAPPEHVDLMEAMARGGDEARLPVLAMMWGDRLGDGWLAYKAARWRATADPEAAARYVRMFAVDGVPDPTAPIRVPVLAIAGEQDAPPMRSGPIREALAPIAADLTVVALVDCGHYPMQEAPPLTCAVIQVTLSK